MKKILFVMPKFAIGGAEKSLLMLLYELSQRNDYEIDLLLFKKEGVFLNKLPSNINLVDLDDTMKCAYSKFAFKNIRGFRSFCLSVLRPPITYVLNKITNHNERRNQLRWKYCYKLFIKKNKKHYDYACAYLDGESTYYVIDKVNADKKYVWNQNDYNALNHKPKLDRPYFKKADKIIVLSAAGEEIFLDNFPDCKSKLFELPPIVSRAFLMTEAQNYYPEEYKNCSSTYRIVSVGRLTYQKGFDIAVNAAKILKDNGVNFSWFIIGNGEELERLVTQIKELSLEENVFLLGQRENPYPYIINADIFAQPSRFEGWSVILGETKKLYLPIIVTDYDTVNDQITHMKNGYIVKKNDSEIAEAIQLLLNDKNLCKTLSDNLKAEESNDKVVNKYMSLFD